jgi:hypothetical protein
MMHPACGGRWAAFSRLLEMAGVQGFHAADGMTCADCTVFLQARKFGVRSAMPGFIARKLCPQVWCNCWVACLLCAWSTHACGAAWLKYALGA